MNSWENNWARKITFLVVDNVSQDFFSVETSVDLVVVVHDWLNCPEMMRVLCLSLEMLVDHKEEE